MKVLFICRSNAERSQVAAAFFNRLSKKNKAVSAGTSVEQEHAIGQPAGRIVTELMLDIGYDLQKKKRKQLTPKLAKSADIIVVTLSDSDIDERLPNYVKHSPKTRFWNLKFHPPRHVYTQFPPRTYDYHIELVMRIGDNVKKLVTEID
jgi:protein-tyrosine-phosphatase